MSVHRRHGSRRVAPRRIVLVSVVALLSPVAALASAAPAGASCAAPVVQIEPAAGDAGASVTVHGLYWSGDCNDTGQTIPDRPLTNIDLTFTQAGRSTALTTVDADASLEFTAVVTVPGDASPGPAAFVATPQGRGALAAEVDFTVTGDPISPPAPPVPLDPDFTG